jgi:hypothetical protein
MSTNARDLTPTERIALTNGLRRARVNSAVRTLVSVASFVGASGSMPTRSTPTQVADANRAAGQLRSSSRKLVRL